MKPVRALKRRRGRTIPDPRGCAVSLARDTPEASSPPRRHVISTSRRTPESLAKALEARWQSATRDQQLALGRVIWQDMLETPVGDLLPRAALEEAIAALLTPTVTRALWQDLPRAQLLSDVQRLRDSGLTLGQAVGPEAADLLRKGAAAPWQPNRELLEELLDQPLLRQALRNLVQKSMQQFLSQINLMGAGNAATGSILGTIGRGIAQRAEKAAQIGKTFMEGVGGGLYRQVESQLQPFLAAFMNRSVKLLSEGLFEGEQAGLAREARLHGLEILLNTPVSKLTDEPEIAELERRLKVGEAIGAHLTGHAPYTAAIQALAVAVYERVRAETLKDMLTRLETPLEPEPALLEAFGQLGYHYVSRPAALRFLLDELKEVW